ncbi:MAG TPA: vWA domain-containing protein [Gemmataceae bacterium]|nr:vWA domain-containing protein [Gemmataceae bacterium]
MVVAAQWGLAVAGAVMLLAVAAEVLHARRVIRAAPLAFGPRRRVMYPVAILAAILRTAAAGAAGFGLATLALLGPKTHKSSEIKESEYRHLVLVLDVSPSMAKIDDAGPTGKQMRSERAADLIESFFQRVAAEKYKTTLIAVYTDAKVVALDTTDREVIRNILTEIPLRHAFKAGETNMFAGLEEAAKVAKPWAPGSAVLMVVTDGDSVPSTGMPKMPASIGNNVVFVGVGNPNIARPIGPHMSRQDVSTLRQTAARLNGVYHDGNQNHMTTELVSRIDEKASPKDQGKWTEREYALLALGAGAGVLALLPAVLAVLGTGWSPGRRVPAVGSMKVEPTRAGVGV